MDQTLGIDPHDIDGSLGRRSCGLNDGEERNAEQDCPPDQDASSRAVKIQPAEKGAFPVARNNEQNPCVRQQQKVNRQKRDGTLLPKVAEVAAAPRLPRVLCQRAP